MSERSITRESTATRRRGRLRIRVAAAAGSAVLLLLGGTVGAFAKEGVDVRLDAAIPRSAAAGSTIEVGWHMQVLDGSTWQPFSAEGMFVRLLGATPGSVTEAAATGGTDGHYRARIVVPKGGIADVQIGLHGSCVGAGCGPNGDDLFPIAGVGPAPEVVPVSQLDATIDPLRGVRPNELVDVVVRASLIRGASLDGRVFPGSVIVRVVDPETSLATYVAAAAEGGGVYRASLQLPRSGPVMLEAGIGTEAGITHRFPSSETRLALAAASAAPSAPASAPSSAGEAKVVTPDVAPAIVLLAVGALVVLGLALAHQGRSRRIAA